MKNKIMLASIVIGLVYFLQNQKNHLVKEDQVEANSTLSLPSIQNPTKVSEQRENSKINRSVAATPPPQKENIVTNELPSVRQEYFKNKILTDKNAKALFERTSHILKGKPGAALIAEYIAESIKRTNTAEFQMYMQDLMKDLNSTRDDIFKTLVESEADLKKDSFIYQMVLNLGYAIQFDPEKKVRVLGGGLTSPFSFNNNGTMSDSSTNITNALILLKNSQLTSEDVKIYVIQGYEINKGNAKALAEFKARVQAYYPELLF